jgi:hypothetical protein
MASREKMVKVERENEASDVPAIKNFMMLWIWIIPEISLYFFFLTYNLVPMFSIILEVSPSSFENLS